MWLFGACSPAYNPSFSTYFFSRNNIFLSHQISQQCFPAGLSAQPNGALVGSRSLPPSRSLRHTFMVSVLDTTLAMANANLLSAVAELESWRAQTAPMYVTLTY
jgi:hypothetical protein